MKELEEECALCYETSKNCTCYEECDTCLNENWACACDDDTWMN